MKNPLLVCLVSVLLLSAWGCAHEQLEPRSAQELFQEAVELAEKNKVEEAAEKYLEVRTYYPAHELAKKALLATADLYYEKEDYASALQSYEEYRLLYPTDPQTAYSLYRIGMSHFKQISSPDRDQTETVRAIQTFDTFLTSYPGSPYAREVQERLTEAKSVLAEHYVYIGKFYLKKKKYQAACSRFKYVRENYPGVPLSDDLDELIARSCEAADGER
ncbi:MAG: outer membrane protein assembly factor BamD [Desulfomonilia bacterium]|jgi:outer membrane protein assembly factor BamD